MYYFGFVIEQVLGHVTHTRNLQRLIPQDASVQVAWGLPTFETSGISARIPLFNSNWTVRAGLRARRALAEIEREFSQCGQHPDVLFFHTQLTAALSPDWLSRYPSIISLDATPLQMDQLGAVYDHPTSAPWLENLKMRLYQSAFSRAKKLVTWSEWARQGLISEYGVDPDKIVVIPPGVDPALWARKTPLEPAGGALKILFVGGDLDRKGGKILLSAFRRLRDSRAGAPVELHLVTKEDIPAEEGVFTYHAMQPNSPELIELYHASDIFCLPTFGDCLPMVLSEAAAAGLPVISTRVAGIPEVVVDGQTGLTIPVGSDEAVYQALLRLVEDPDLRVRMGKAGAAHVDTYYNASKNANRLVQMMKEIAAGAKEGTTA